MSNILGLSSVSHTAPGTMKSRSRWAKITAAFSGVFSVFLGFLVIIGWHTNNLALIRLREGFPPMHYNPAIGFMAWGAGLLCILAHRRIQALTPGILIFGLGFIAILQNFFAWDLRIDRLLFEPSPALDLNSGRIATNEGLCFVLLGIVLIVLSSGGRPQRRPLVVSLLGSVVISLGGVTTVGYVAQITSVYHWEKTPMALQSAVGFVIAGMGAVALAWHEGRFKGAEAPTWLPFVALIGGLSCTLLLWQALRSLPDAGFAGPFSVLAAGSIMSLLLFGSVYLAQKASLRARQAEAINQELQNQIAERTRAEKALQRAQEQLEIHVAERTAVLKTQIMERKRAEELLTFNEAKFRDLFDNAPVGYHELDGTGRFTRINRTELQMLGYSAEEMLGRYAWDFVLESEEHRLSMEARLSGQVVAGPYEMTFVRKDGGKIPVLVENALIHATGGTIAGIRSTIQDISEIKLMEDALKKAHDKLELRVVERTLELSKANAMLTEQIEQRKLIEQQLHQARDAALESANLKSQFLANMSHEVRTPLNAVMGMTGLLLDTNLTSEQREFAETVRSSAEALMNVINDILDFSKIEAGKLSFETLDFDLQSTMEGAVELLAGSAHEKGIEIASLLDDNVPRQLVGDPGRLRQILINLVNNAIKFTERGEVVVRASLEGQTPSDAVLHFSVTDTGIGISEDARQLLFQPFSQADGSTTRRYGGTGLGLAISKQLVELMDGEIGVESTPGKGSTFWFSARFDKQKGPQQAAVLEPTTDVKRSRVLIVDDNATNRKILTLQLQSWGIRNDTAPRGEDTLAMLRSEAATGDPYQIVILDMRLPDMDGLTLARKIKADASIAGTRLLMMTSLGQRDKAALQDAQVEISLTKPVRPAQLLDCLASVVARQDKPAGRQARAAHSSVEIHLSEEVLRRRADTRLLVAEDNVVNRKVAVSQLKRLGYTPDVVSTGREAVGVMQRFFYDVILMDCQMPDMDGYAATREIRLLEGSTRHTTIIAMTAHALQGDREKCLAAGMDDYLVKPVRAEDLESVLDSWILGNGRKEAGKSAKSGSGRPKKDTAQDSGPVDNSVLSNLRALQADGAPDILSELIDLYLQDAPTRLAAARQALIDGNAKAISREAHALKSSCGNLGAVKMVELSRTLEERTRSGSIQGADEVLTQLELEFRRVESALQAERRKHV